MNFFSKIYRKCRIEILPIDDRKNGIFMERPKLSMVLLYTNKCFRNFIEKCDSFNLNLWFNFLHQKAISETALKELSIWIFGVFCIKLMAGQLDLFGLMLLAINNFCSTAARKYITILIKKITDSFVFICWGRYFRLLHTRAKQIWTSVKKWNFKHTIYSKFLKETLGQ